MPADPNERKDEEMPGTEQGRTPDDEKTKQDHPRPDPSGDDVPGSIPGGTPGQAATAGAEDQGTVTQRDGSDQG